MALCLFVMKYPLHLRENLRGKFDGQMAAMRALGHEVYCIGWNRQGMWLLGEGKQKMLMRCPLTRIPGYDHTFIFVDLMRAVRKVLKERKVDLLYWRYMPTFGNALGTAKAIKAQGGKLVMEFPTFPREEENRRSLLRRPVFVYADRVLHKLSPLIDLYTAIGQPCGGKIDDRPAMNIVNGVDVERFPLHIPNPGNREVHLLAVASMAGWHGYDRLLRAMAEYQGPVKVYFHLAGSDGDGSLSRWKELAQEMDLDDRAVFHGPLYGEELNRLVASCDVGVGSLGMFRFGLTNGMPLKLREYMARGLPFVYAVEDAAIPQNPRFCLKVSNDDCPIDLEPIVDFALRAKEDGEAPRLMREHARHHMSWQSVMNGVLERLDR
ncbi:MAG: glycosyltransferase family 4 protein [Clostridiales bacterium]|nr:glycosyltransferase family 4 protein [Clostridiales bacterium]